MLSKITIIASLAFIPFAAAQDGIGIDLQAIKAHFQQSHLVPDLLENFDPTALLAINYEGVGDVTPGQALTNDQVGPTPTITITAPEGTELSGNYTLAMVDPGHVGADTAAGVTRHWLVNGVTIAGNALNQDAAVAITTYAGPFPPEGDGPHRYAILLYAQPEAFAPPAEFSQPDMGVSLFDLTAYVTNSGLGSIVAGNYITVERGQSTASIAETTAVDSATLTTPSGTDGASETSGTGTDTSSGAEETDAADDDTDAASALSVSPFLALAGVVMMLVA